MSLVGKLVRGLLVAWAGSGALGCAGGEAGEDDDDGEAAVASAALSRDASAADAGAGKEEPPALLGASSCPAATYLCGSDGLGGSSTQLFYCSGKGALPKLVEQCVGACITVPGMNDRCPVVNGWSSQTGYRRPLQPVLGSIAASVAPGPAPQSIAGASPTWLTDASGGDGQRMRSALGDLHAWYQAQSPKPSLPLASVPGALRSKMLGRLTTSYDSKDAIAIVDRAIALYMGMSPPPSDDATLSFFGMRAQCKEYADRLVKAAGGTPKVYTPVGIASRDVRQGDYAFLYSGSAPKHAAIILDVYWQDGAPTQLRLGESNWGSGWSQPVGEVPWSRQVRTQRVVPYTSYVVVSSL